MIIVEVKLSPAQSTPKSGLNNLFLIFRCLLRGHNISLYCSHCLISSAASLPTRSTEWNEKFKSRLVAQGFSRRYGIDYEETISLAARFSSIHTILVYAAQSGLLVHQMHVIVAFLNGNQRKTYILATTNQTAKEDLVCKLKKS